MKPFSFPVIRKKKKEQIVFSIPKDMIANDISVPTAPKSMIVMKFLKNCFFFTWNLLQKKQERMDYYRCEIFF